MFTTADVGSAFVDGKVVELSDAEKQVIADEWNRNAQVTDAEWFARIEARAEEALNGGITITANGIDYLVRSGPDARSKIAGAGLVADRAIRNGTSVTFRIPTDKGIVHASETQLSRLFDIMTNHHEAVMERVEQLHAKVTDGTITDADLDTGWP